MFAEAWRMERDYFYDTGMQGVDWKANRAKYEPLVARVRSRAELADLVGQMVSELSALHTFVYGGDMRDTNRHIEPSRLGGTFAKDPLGFKVVHITAIDSPADLGPLARPETDVKEGEISTAVDGRSAAAVNDLEGSSAIAQAAGALHVRDAASKGATPWSCRHASPRRRSPLRRVGWTRRQAVERDGHGRDRLRPPARDGHRRLGGVRARLLPAFDKQGLVIDVRGNGGGNIDGWILSTLLRKAWFFWSQRVGHKPQWNMQYAFRGHIAVPRREHRLRRRGVHRRLQAPGPRPRVRHAHVETARSSSSSDDFPERRQDRDRRRVPASSAPTAPG